MSELSPDIWREIASSADFPRVVEDVIYHARQLADRDENPFFESVIGLAQTLEQLHIGPRRPRKKDRQFIESIWPMLKSQAPAEGAAGAELYQRMSALCEMVLTWPKDAKDDDEEESDDENFEPEAELETAAASEHLSRLEATIVAIHEIQGQLAKLAKPSKKRDAKGRRMAQARREAARGIQDELDNRLKAIESWATEEVWPTSAAKDFAWGMGSPLQLLRYLPEQAAAIESVRAEFSALRRLPRFAGEGKEINSFGDLVRSLRWARRQLAEALGVYSDHQGLRSIESGFEEIAREISGWISNGGPRGESRATLARVLAADLDLPDWPQHAAVQSGVHTLARQWKNWPPESMNDFRRTLFETAVDLDLLRTVSASAALDNLAHNIQQVLYLTAKEKEPAQHERNEVRLEEAVSRELDLYAWAKIKPFLATVREIDSFWQRWIPGKAGAAGPSDESHPTRHDIERGMLIAIQNFAGTTSGQRPPNDAKPCEADGYSRAYFHHLLEGQSKNSCTLPMRHPFSRAMGLELCAMRRWVDQGRNPTLAEQGAADFAFEAIANISPGIGTASNDRDLAEAFNINRYFQIWPMDDKTMQWPKIPAGIIADSEQFKTVINEVWADATCLLVLMPDDSALLDLARQLRRVGQCAEYGRELDDAERTQVGQALRMPPQVAVGVFPNVPDFPEAFVDRVRQIHDFYFGIRASSRKSFIELLRVTRDELRQIQRGRCWDQDIEPLAAIDRQLRAVQRWSAGNRQPTPPEQAATCDVLSIVAELRGLSQMQEWSKRVLELSKAFNEGLPPGDARAETASTGFESIEELTLALEDAQNDCRSFCGRRLMRKPVGPEIAWDELEKRLAVVRRMVEQGRVPTRRERADIHAALTNLEILGPNPAASIHDFLEELTDRLSRIDAHYTWLVTAGPYAGKETGALDEGGIQWVELGGEMQIAFFRKTEAESGIYVCRAEKTSRREQAGAIELDVMQYLPSTRDLVRLVPCDGWEPTHLAWNAHSDWLAYQIPGRSPQVGWCATREAGEKGRVAADAFAWATQGSSFIAIDLASASVFRVKADTVERKALVTLPDDIDHSITPQIAICPGGQSLALSFGRKGGKIELALVEFEGNQPQLRSRGLFVGAKHLLISWLNSIEIGCLLVTPADSEMLRVPSAGGEATTLHKSKIPLVTSAPASSTGGKYTAFFRPISGAEATLSLLDSDSREILTLLKPNAVRGRLSFGEETISIQGIDAAIILWPHISFSRKPVERF